MVMAGLVAQTPHMQSATVMALTRLIHEFAGELEGFMPRLLLAVISLLRTKSREVVKSILAFLKVGWAAYDMCACLYCQNVRLWQEPSCASR